MARRTGMVPTTFGFDIFISGQFRAHGIGDAVQLINKAGGVAIGDTSLPIDQGGAYENYNHGDIITFANDDNKYVVAEGSGNSATTVKIGAPGLRKAATNNAAISIGDSYMLNMAFSKDAFVLAVRVPAVNQSGGAGERIYIPDPVSGLMYEISTWGQYRQSTIEVAICWGVKSISPEHSAILLG